MQWIFPDFWVLGVVFQGKKTWQISWATENHQDETLRCPLITAFGVALPHLPSWERQKYSSQVMEKGKWFAARSWGLNWEVGLTGVLHWNSFGHTPDLTVSSLREAHKWKTFSGENLKFRVYGGKEVIVPSWVRIGSRRRWPPYWKKIQKWIKDFWRHLYKDLWTYCVHFKNCDEACPFPPQMPIFFSNMHRCPHTGHTITLFNILRFNLSLN